MNATQLRQQVLGFISFLLTSSADVLLSGGASDTEVAVVAVGPTGVVTRFAALSGSAAPGSFTAILRSAGTYVLTVTSGGKLATGWPRTLEVVPACDGPLCCVIKGDALNGVTCGRAVTLTLSTADKFGNPRCALQVKCWRAHLLLL